MGLDLKDFRTKLLVATMAVILGMAETLGKGDAETARKLFNGRAESISHATTLAYKYREVEGVAGNGDDSYIRREVQ